MLLIFVTCCSLRWGLSAPLSNRQAVVPPIFCFPYLFVQYIRKHRSRVKVISIYNLRTRHDVVLIVFFFFLDYFYFIPLHPTFLILGAFCYFRLEISSIFMFSELESVLPEHSSPIVGNPVLPIHLFFSEPHFVVIFPWCTM